METNTSDLLQFVPYDESFHAAYKAMNKAWIEKLFVLEPLDIEMMENPDKFIINEGGAIIMALYKNETVGTCSLKNKGNQVFELAKMTVVEGYRGLQIGYQLGVATLQKARDLKARKIVLYSNRAGAAAAIQLYYKLGFVEVPLDEVDYKRADIKMELTL